MQWYQQGWDAVTGGLQECPASSPCNAKLIFNHGNTHSK